MTPKIVHLDAEMTKDQLVRHLQANHSYAVGDRPIHRFKKWELVEAHRLIHLGIGR